MIDINLLPPQNALSQKEKKVRFYLTVGVTFFSALAAFVIVALNSVYGYVYLTQKNLSDRKAALVTQFESQNQKAADMRQIKDKLAGINSIRKSETRFEPIVTNLISLFSSDVNVSRFAINRDRTISFTAEADEINGYDALITRLTTGRDSKKYSRIVIQGLREDIRRALTFSVELIYE